MSFTNVPNYFFDSYLKQLKPSETVILLVIIRQTLGWYDKRTRSHKKSDWISHRFFEEKTGLSLRTISSCIDELILKGMIVASNQWGQELENSEQRRNTSKIFYELKPLEHKKQYYQKGEAVFLTDQERHEQIMAQKKLQSDL